MATNVRRARESRKVLQCAHVLSTLPLYLHLARMRWTNTCRCRYSVYYHPFILLRPYPSGLYSTFLLHMGVSAYTSVLCVALTGTMVPVPSSLASTIIILLFALFSIVLGDFSSFIHDLNISCDPAFPDWFFLYLSTTLNNINFHVYDRHAFCKRLRTSKKLGKTNYNIVCASSGDAINTSQQSSNLNWPWVGGYQSFLQNVCFHLAPIEWIFRVFQDVISSVRLRSEKCSNYVARLLITLNTRLKSELHINDSATVHRP